MPELPEVETVVRGLRPVLVGRTLQGLWCDWPRAVHSPSLEEFADRVRGQRVLAVERRAKYIVIQLEHDYLLVHLKMTGRLYVSPCDRVQEADRWVHVRFPLDGAEELRFSDSRKFGRVYLTSNPTRITGDLGPEPLAEAFSAAEFAQRLKLRDKGIKALLLDQTFIAGVGNIYADEALFRARIHPLTRSRDLTDAQITTLYETVRAALADGIAREGASVNWYRKADGSRGSAQDSLFVYGRAGQPCRVCGTPLQKIRVAQRGTHFCPSCQSFEGV
ncbi:bifunctional DNA-formamidopyrimidine glycosylase/DNA-(apurinic or apyrimidinic site) lyase [Aggregatilineales bacterium SYSU G02658]